ncbi:hypothetical protein Tco_0812216 [Tanacetum coccineum]
MCKDDKLRVMRVMLQGVMLMHQGLFRTREMLLQPNQRYRGKSDLGTDARALATTAIFQTDDLDAFDSDCDGAPTTSVVFMANLSTYDSDILYEVQNYDTYQDNNVIDQSVQEMHYYEQPVFVDDSNIEITNDSNVISYDQYLKENENEVVQSNTSHEQQDAMIMSVIDEMSNQVAKCNAANKENKIKNKSLTVKLKRYKEPVKVFKKRQTFALTDQKKHIDSQRRVKKLLNTQMDVLKKDFSEKQDKYIEEIMDLEKKKKALDNIVYKTGQTIQTLHMLTKPQAFYDNTHKTALGYQYPLFLCKAQRKQPVMYYGSALVEKHDAISVLDTEETLKLAKESRLKMNTNQNDQIVKEKKVDITPIDYASLNKLNEYFVPQKQLFAEKPSGYQFLKQF